MIMRLKNSLISILKKETVLSIAVILAMISMFAVHPDKRYLEYIDFRTICILFALMVIVAAFKSVDFFVVLADKLTGAVKKKCTLALVLVLLCFFASMIITNDVALITFVPFGIIVFGKLPEGEKRSWIIRVVIMETIAANLGSMLTPIGNPQNLYLFGISGMNITDFLELMLPYAVVSLVLLLVWIAISGLKDKKSKGANAEIKPIGSVGSMQKNKEILIVYLALFMVMLLVVGRIVPYQAAFIMVLLYTAIRQRKLLREVDYSLLGTFAALFIFIGNLGRIPDLAGFIEKIMAGHEVQCAVAASQVMSNVPAAILLSGFTGNIRALIVGTNLGGLGTLIASMASLISFRYIAREDRSMKGSDFVWFTLANIIFLFILMIFYICKEKGIC